MTAALRIETVEAYPCGRPSDRERYGMTPLMAIIYADIVEQHGHNPIKFFKLQFIQMSRRINKPGIGNIHDAVYGLVERGWIEPIRKKAYASRFRFVEPVMRFPSVPKRMSER